MFNLSRLPWAPVSTFELWCAALCPPWGTILCGTGCWAAQVSHLLELVLRRGACPKSRIFPLICSRVYEQDGAQAAAGRCLVSCCGSWEWRTWALLRSEQPKRLICLWSKYSWDLFLCEGSDWSDGLQKGKAEMFVEKAAVEVQQQSLIYHVFHLFLLIRQMFTYIQGPMDIWRTS